MKKYKKRIKNGFTLVEVMVAVLILGIIAVGGASFSWRAASMMKNSDTMVYALNYAENLLESTKSNSLTNLLIEADDAISIMWVDSTREWTNAPLPTWTHNPIGDKLWDSTNDEWITISDTQRTNLTCSAVIELKSFWDTFATRTNEYYEISVSISQGNRTLASLGKIVEKR